MVFIHGHKHGHKNKKKKKRRHKGIITSQNHKNHSTQVVNKTEKMPMRGNCLFNVISYFDTGEKNNHTQTRHDVMQHIKDNASKYKRFFCESDIFPTWEKYIDIMSQPAPTDGSPTRPHWGGNIELAAAADLNNWHIQLYITPQAAQSGGKPYQEFGIRSVDTISADSLGNSKKILYKNDCHYEAIVQTTLRDIRINNTLAQKQSKSTNPATLRSRILK